MTEFKKEYEMELKEEIKGLVDEIQADNYEDFRVLKMIYGFVRAGLRENRAGKLLHNHE